MEKKPRAHKGRGRPDMRGSFSNDLSSQEVKWGLSGLWSWTSSEAQSGGAGSSLSTFSKRNQRKFQEYWPQEGAMERHIGVAQFKSPPFAKHSSVELPLGPLGSPQILGCRRCCLQVFLCFPFSLYLCLSPDMEKEREEALNVPLGAESCFPANFGW